MKNSKKTTAVGIGMILGTIPCTLAGFLMWYLTSVLANGQAAGQGVDIIGLAMMTYFAYLLALASCIIGVLYFWLSRSVTLKAWHRFGIIYSLAQVSVATIYMSTR
jgi:hypothetical protein